MSKFEGTVEHYAKGLCQKCYMKNREKEVCIKCGEEEPVQERDKDGNAICKKCYNETYEAPKEICIKCKEEKEVEKRDKNGNPMCKKCYNKDYEPPTGICVKCKEEKEVHIRDESGNAICKKCYEPPTDMCIKCREEKPVEKRDKNGNPICKKCYEPPIEICIKCKEEKEVHIRDENNNAVCRKCHDREKYHKDEKYRITVSLRRHLQHAFKNYSKTGKVKKSKEYGIDYQAIFDFLGPCPGEKEDYHIDHIFPLSAFDFDNLIHIKAAFAPENHQWLLVKDNLKKSAKYNEEEFDNYINRFL